MKKIALGILSVFMLFGGVVLSACSGSNPSISVSSNYIEICTNDADMDNYQSGNISVTLEGSNDGIGVQVESGSDVVTYSVNETSSSQYTVTLSAIRSGDARVRVFSRENQNIYEYINVSVLTVPTDTSLIDQNGEDGRTSMYVVKNGNGTSLDVDSYISFEPADANVKDVVWSFNPAGQDVSTQVIQSSPDGSSSSVIAEIRDNMLYVCDGYNQSQISVYAILTSSTSLSKELTFQVIEDSDFTSFAVNNISLLDTQTSTEDVTVELVRNNSSDSGEYLSRVFGQVRISTFDEEMTVTPRAFLVSTGAEVDYSEYFSFTYNSTYDASMLTINFVIDALYDDFTLKKLFGDLYFDLVLNYSDYTYSISSRDKLQKDLILSLSFLPESVVVRDSDGNDIGNNVIDLYSQYYNSQGYLVYANVYPDDIPLENNSYRIRIDIGGLNSSITTVDDVLQVHYRNSNVKVNFSQWEGSSTTYVSEEISNGTSVYLRCGNLGGLNSINGFNIYFIASENSAIAYETITANLYRISMGTSMQIEEVLYDEEGNPSYSQNYSSTKYLSSARNELGVADSQEYYFRISGISSIEGLSLQGGNNRNFTITMEEYARSSQGASEQYIIIRVTVELNSVEFRDYTSFSFSHRSGLTSNDILLEAFTPLSSVAIYNDSRGANNIYDEASEGQDYILSNGELDRGGNENMSLSSILVSAGSNVSLLLDYQNATLNTTNTAGYQFFYLESARTDLTDEDFAGLSISRLIELGLVNSFEGGVNNYFTSSNGELRVNDSQFTIFVMVEFYGYDEDHNDITFVRFFKLESFYPVTSLRSNISETELLSWESLSTNDESLSQVDIRVTLRNDDHPATYSDLSYFKVILGTGTSYVSNNEEIADATLLGLDNNFSNMVSLADISYIYNDYLLLTNFRVVNNELRFNIRAQSTKLQSNVNEIVSIQYAFKNSVYPEIINVNITEVDRVEEVIWLNETTDSQIYLNLASDDNSEKTFTINTSVGPSEAYNRELSYYYQPMDNNQNILQITTSSIGQTFTLSIRDNSQGGWGYLYLLPSDMIKIEGGRRSAIAYQLVDGEYEPYYLYLDEIHTWYSKLINGEDGNLNYFLNNDDERVYYSDIIVRIRVTVADGRSEETAVRVYDENDFLEIKNNPDLYYRVMNDITLEEWESFDFSGMIFGNSDNITLTMSGQGLMHELSGVIKDLTIRGTTTSGAFVANFITGRSINISEGDYTRPTVENVNIDVVYDGDVGSYTSSVLSGSYVLDGISYSGAIASVNAGVIRDCKVYGVTMNTNGVNYVGGVAGYSYGTITGSGVEFYNFADNTTNTISGNTVGGLVGYFGADGSNATITDSYVYAFNLNVGIGESRIDSYSTNISATRFYALAGTLDTSGTNTIETSFAFMGDYTYLVPNNSNVTIRNSYITYYYPQDGVYYPAFNFYNSNGGNLPMTYDQLATANWDTFDSEIWETENISSEINFGYAYLKDVTQTPNVSVDQTIKTVDGKSLAVDDGANGILFYYNVKELITNSIANGELRNYNTITVSDLFGVTDIEAESLLVSVNNQEYAFFSNSTITTQRTTDNYAGRKLTLTLTSRTDFSEIKTFDIMILDVIPEFTTSVNGTVISDSQIINIQTGINNTQSVNVVVDDGLYLYGERYTLTLDDYVYYNAFDITNETGDEEYFSAQVIGNTVIYEALSASGNSYVNANISLSLQNLTGDSYSYYIEAINENYSRTITLSSYDGANSLIVDSTNLSLRPLETTSFNAILNSDRADDGIAIQFQYNDEIYEVDYTDENNGSVVINDNLMLDISITKSSSSSLSYNVLISVNRDYRYRVDTDYNLTILVRPQSQRSSDNYLRTIGLFVQKQTIEDVNVVNYLVSGRQLHNSTWYYNRSEQLTSTITPGTETILSVEVNPNFAHMTNFSVSYTLSNSAAGSISLSRLIYNQYYGYYIDSSTTQAINDASRRGIMITPTDEDLRNGIYYFRLYVSSSFSANSVINITFTFYDGAEVLYTSLNSYSIDYLQEAVVLVNGESSVMLAKSQSATVTVNVESDQTLDRIFLNGHGQNITITNAEAVDYNTYTTYTATINTSVLSTLANGESTGAFTVEASVVSYVNGVATYKYSYATIYLVDFTVDAEDVTIENSSSTSIYGGQEYDTFISYINASSLLSFDYQIEPESYNYNTSNTEEVEAVNQILSNRRAFLSAGTYSDERNNYYINYRFNSDTNRPEELSLRDRLYYVNSDGSATAIYNSSQNSFLENSTFDFSGGTSGNDITIKGKQSGSVLLRLKTYVIIGNSTFEYDYDFVVTISIWSDEEVPIPIYTADEFLTYLEGNPDSEGNTEAGDYILMNDIVLTNYTPLSTQYFDSLDGNGYTIYLNSYAFDNSTSTLNIALFSEVTENSTIRNVRVNIYNSGKLTVNINQFSNINIAGFTLVNNGIIYNCDVVAFYDANNSLRRESGATGLVVDFVIGNGGQATDLTTGNIAPENINIAGFVLNNNNVITNSRVGGETYGYILEEFDERFYDEMDLPLFTIQGQGYVSGFVGENSGTISASFASNVEITNSMRTTLSQTAGFVRENLGEINTSYVKGQYDGSSADDYHYDGSSISTTGNVGGFVYYNNGTIRNSYVNFSIEIDVTRSYLAAGYVYENSGEGVVTLCFAQVKMSEADSAYINNMYFSGVDQNGNSLNANADGITYCYYYADEREVDIQSGYDVGAYAISATDDESVYYRFSFTSVANAVDGIWMMLDDNRGVTLASADHIAFSNRYIVYHEDNEEEYDLFYSTLRDYDTRALVDLSYGSFNNPIIIRDAEEFARATGRATDVEISSYREYYNDTEVFGNYRFVSDIDFSTIDQNLDDNNSVRLTTTTKDFSGILDGNGFTITNMILEASNVVENYGLFARINGGSILNLGLEVTSVHNGNASIVGTLAGTVIDGRIMAITLNPVSARDEEDALVAISIHGNNIVGGVVGAVFGNSKLSDIIVEDVDVAANYYDETKAISDNEDMVGEALKSVIEAGGSIYSNVSTLSYAGGLAGYVDIYEYADENDVTYTGSVDYSTYDILTVRIYNSINIYGEVAGGIVGYMSGTTTGYDLGLELNADMSLTTPSYITAKNLFAGGIVGESYGGLFACYAEYSRELQDTIEESMYSYYNGASTSERGQQSIFSYTAEENDSSVNRHNDPYYVGGLVGYAGGGFISTSYNRLNVVSNNSSKDSYEAYFGGIVGGVDADNYYNSQVMLARNEVSYFLDEVYFSGVLNSTENSNVNVAGAIGFISSESIVGMKKVNTMPYYELESERSKIFGLIGGFENTVDDLGDIENITLPSHLYFLDNINGHYDLITGNILQGGESVSTSLSVSATYLSEDDVAVNAETRYNYVFGFRDLLINVNTPGAVDAEDSSMFDLDNARIRQVEWMRDLSTMDLAYTRMSQYFLRNDWNPNYWEHEVNTLYPRIVLTPRTNVVYLDADEDSIERVLGQIENDSSITVVVRGRIDEDDPTFGWSDVDLRAYIAENNYSITNFSGTFVSYEEYMNSNDEGIITTEITDDGNILGGIIGENVGLILDRPLFRSVNYGFEMRNLNLYFTSESGVTNSSLLVSQTATRATFDTLDIHINNYIELQANSDGVAGLLTAEAVATDFLNINIIFRRSSATTTDSDITFTDREQDDLEDQYFGILAGRMTQNTVYKSMTVSNINFAVEKTPTSYDKSTEFDADETPNIQIDFEKTANNIENLYFGLLAGDSVIEADSSSSIFRMTSLNRYLENDYSIEINFDNHSSGSLETANIGSYFGRANLTYIEGTLSDDGYPLNGITINQNIDVETEYLGLGFGQVSGGGTMSVSTNVTTALDFTVAGTLNQGGEVGTAYIGGFIGQASVNTIDIDNTVATSVAIYGASNITDIANFGSLIGDLTGNFSARSFETDNALNMTDANPNVNVNYGLIGSLSGSGSISVGSTTSSGAISNDSVVISNVSTGNINIGGVVGLVSSDYVNSVITINRYINSSTYNLSNCVNMVVGGVIGNSSNAEFDITSSGFGGMLYVTANNNNALSVGGIVGVASQSESQSVISSAYIYGDVFVNYASGGASTSEIRLDTYNFGGVVGRYEVEDTTTTGRLSISNSYSLMSSFNSRITSSISDYNVNAFVGFGSESVEYYRNYYASGVTFAIQAEEGNTDSYYTAADSTVPTYYGYSLENDDLEPVSENIVYVIRSGINSIIGGTTALNRIDKLNPIELTSSNIDTFNSTNADRIYYDNSDSRYGDSQVLETGINWFYLSGDLGGEDEYVTSRIEELNNSVIVGNGQTINFRSVDGGGVGEDLLNNYGFIENMSTTGGAFSVVSNLIINNDVSVVSNSNSFSVGGLVGFVGSRNESSSILYAVGVNGDITVGGRGNVVVGGIVGDMQSGAMINNAYFDGDIYYSAGTGGEVNGISHNQSYLEIFNTFSAGAIQTLFSQNSNYDFVVNLFNSTSAEDLTNIYDSYTIMQHISRDYGAGVYDGEANEECVGDATNFFSDVEGSDYENYSVGYGGISYRSYSLNADRSAEVNEDGSVSVDDAETLDLWFYSPYKNYGYATTGFGFLRNITVASRESTTSANYTYTILAIEDVAAIINDDGTFGTADYFYPILNSVQFDEMLDMSSDIDINVKDMQYMLRYDITLTKAIAGDDDFPEDFATSKEFILDGRSNTVTFTSNGNAIFETIYGTMENMQIVIDKKITSSSLSANTSAITDTSDSAISIYGSLANEIVGGTLNNISVEASMEINDEYKIVGGVVGMAVNSTIKAVESLVNFDFTADESNSIVGGVVGYSIGSTIEYSSNASNIRIKDGYARASTSESITGDDVTELFEESGYDLPVLSYIDGLYSARGTISITTSNENNGTDSGTYELTSSPSVILGGVVGVVIDGSSVDYSYNTASIINGYEQFEEEDTKRVGTVVSGGIAGYSDGVEISNSFNAGYVVSGNMYNTCTVNVDDEEVTRGYPALAGGIVGYTTGDITNCFNDAKVQAVSYLDSSDYSYSLENNYSKSLLDANGASSTIEITITSRVEYNVNSKNRLVFAYALGYVEDEGTTAIIVTGRNGDNAEITNDGNIGYISVENIEKSFTLQRYYGIYLERNINDGAKVYNVSDSFDFESDPYPYISGYDSYGFPNRYNLKYSYTFDINILREVNFWYDDVATDNAMKFTITDNTPNSTLLTDIANISVDDDSVSIDLRNQYNNPTPGGTTQYYLSIPLYDTTEMGYFGNSYEEYLYRLNNNNNTCNHAYTESGNISEIYNAISDYTDNNLEEKKFNISGSTYSMVFNNNQLASYVRGASLSGTINISNAPTLSKNGETINASSVDIDTLTFTLYNGDEIVVDEDGDNLQPLSYSAYVVQAENSYFNYTVYYDKSALKEEFGSLESLDNLSVSVNYELSYTFNDTITLSQSNVDVSGNTVTFKVPDDGESISFGEYLGDELSSTDLQGEQIQVEFTGTGMSYDIIEPFLEDGAYYVDYDGENAYFTFEDSEQLNAFINALSGSVNMTFYYNIYGAGNYVEDEDLITKLDDIDISGHEYTYYFGLGEYTDVGIVSSENGYVTLEEVGSAIRLNFTNETSIGAVQVQTSNGDIYFYPNGGDAKFNNTFNFIGTGISITADNENNRVVFDFTSEISSYGTYRDMLNNASVSVALIDDSVNSVEIPTTMTTEVNGMLITYSLVEEDGYTYIDLGDNTTRVTRPEDSDIVTYMATYTFTSAASETGVGQVIYDENNVPVAIINNNFSINTADDDASIVGVRHQYNVGDVTYEVTYEYSTGLVEDLELVDIFINYGINLEETYYLTTVNYSGFEFEIYKIGTEEITVYNISSADSAGDYIFVKCNWPDMTCVYDLYQYQSDDTLSLVWENVVLGSVLENALLTNPNSNLQNFRLIGLADGNTGGFTGYRVVYRSDEGFYTGDDIDGYTPGSSIYNGATITYMEYNYYPWSSGSNGVISINGMSVKQYSSDVYSSWFVPIETYFVAEGIETNTDTGTQTITFNQNRLNNLAIDGLLDSTFEVQQGSIELSSTTISLNYGNDSESYSRSGGAVDSWDADSSNENIRVTNYSNGETIASLINTTIGRHTAGLKFTATVSEVGVSAFSFVDDLEKTLEFWNIINNADSTIPNIIIGNNIHYDGNMELVDASLYGEGHVLNVYGSMSNWQNLIDVTDGGIDNVKFNFVVDLSEYNFIYDVADDGSETTFSSLIYLTADTQNTFLTNTQMFGSLRNINSFSEGDSEKNVYIVHSSNTLTSDTSSDDANLVSEITSYLTMQGNSAQANSAIASDSNVDGASVNVVLNNINSKVTATEGSSYIVLGDGANGSNGLDGTESGNSGANGGNGGSSGTAKTYIDDSAIIGTVFNGLDGVGGNGGNGADGQNAKSYSVSTGGGGGGAYGANATLIVQSNRRSNNGLGGSGGTGGLGLIYYDAKYVQISETTAALYNGIWPVGAWSVGSYYYGNGDNIVTYYITAAGGGGAGGSDEGVRGNNGKRFSPTEDSSVNRRGYNPRGGQIISDQTYANYGYLWLDHHNNGADEYLMGNLQFIPVFSYWSNNISFDDDFASNTDDFASKFGNIQTLNDLSDGNYLEYYKLRLENYIKEWTTWLSEVKEKYTQLIENEYETENPDEDQISDWNDKLEEIARAEDDIKAETYNWKTLFYGGEGGSGAVAGGTPYTKEIYGFFMERYGVKNQYFFTRNDMVTSAGQYGQAQYVEKYVNT